jgi:CubicO group peptidase (beta-lactamase class C family)
LHFGDIGLALLSRTTAILSHFEAQLSKPRIDFTSVNMPLPRLIASCLLLVTTVSAQKGFTCPILGKQWPAPTNISTEPLLLAAAKNLTSQINQLVHGDGPNWNTTSFSITVFSASEDSFAYEYHRTDPTVLHSKAGVRNVTADSVYRIGSVSKLMSVYLFLIQLGGKYLHTPVSHFIPQLLAHANSSLGDLDVIRPNWRDITVTDLASYLAGIPNDCEFSCEHRLEF